MAVLPNRRAVPAALAPTRPVGAPRASAAPEPPLDPFVGCTVARRYDVEGLIGWGGMGRVYRASERLRGRRVALKVVAPELALHADAARLLCDEAELASRVAHPNVVSVLEHGELAAGRPYLVMEYVGGGSLADRLRRRGPVAPAEAIALMGQLLGALAEVHRAGVVHGDVKSENLMLQPGARGDRLILVDFGLARRLGALRGADGWICGTPEYMAPEVVCDGPAARSADLYAAGIVLFELLTGELPFAAATPLQVIERQLREAAAPPSARRPSGAIPGVLDAVVARALAKAPGERFGCAADMADALAC